MATRLRFALIAAVMAAAFAAPAWAQAPRSFDRIVVFGTSLSDPGNAFALNGGTNTPPDYSVDPLLVPDQPYARGGHHFSNGATWIEQLARTLGLASSAQPAFRSSSAKASNYAVGGARAAAPLGANGLATQVGAFLQHSGGVAPSNALYVIEMGSNDLRDAIDLLLRKGDAAGANAVLEQAIAGISLAVRTLEAAGARRFLLWNAPNIARTPALLPFGAQAGALIDQGLIQPFNHNLTAAIGALGVEVTWLDVYGKLNAITAAPAEFGMTNVTAACIAPDIAPYHCQNFEEYLFWDGIHPTRAAHAILAQEAAGALSR